MRFSLPRPRRRGRTCGWWRGRGHRGVAQQLCEPDLGGATDQDVTAECRRDDAEPIGHGGHRLSPDVGLDPVADVPEQRTEEPAEHDDLGVDGVDGVPQCGRECGDLSVDDPLDIGPALGERRDERVEVVGRGPCDLGEGGA
jgi:hypothetical protein